MDNICTVFSQYFHNMSTIFVQYLPNIRTKYAQYLPCIITILIKYLKISAHNSDNMCTIFCSIFVQYFLNICLFFAQNLSIICTIFKLWKFKFVQFCSSLSPICTNFVLVLRSIALSIKIHFICNCENFQFYDGLEPSFNLLI